MEIEKKLKIIILGAGSSGIGAALLLRENGFDPLILEGRSRRGGRCFTEKIKDIPIDLGASWIHAYNERNPIRQQIKNIKYKLVNEPPGTKLYLDEISGQIDYNLLFDQQDNAEDLLYYAKSNSTENNDNLYGLIKDQYIKLKETQSDLQNRVLDLMISKTEHYYAASIKELSAKYYDHQDFKESGGDGTPEGGYGTLLMNLSEKLNINYNKIVREIIYEKNYVKFICEDESIYESQLGIITLPLGVLKSNLVKFSPNLPEKKLKAIDSLGCGLMNKILLKFKNNFWGEKIQDFSISSNIKGKFPWFYVFDRSLNVLCCFVTDDFAREIELLSDEEIINLLNLHLKNVFKNYDENNLEDFKITKWGKDRFSLGSYSFFKEGSKPEDCDILKENILNTLFFAGEACYKDNIGVCHGAFRTGMDAGQEILNINYGY